MNATATSRGGYRHALTVEHAALGGEGERVRQFGSTATGAQVTLLAASERDPLPDRRTGATSRCEGGWGCTPVAPVAGGADREVAG